MHEAEAVQKLNSLEELLGQLQHRPARPRHSTALEVLSDITAITVHLPLYVMCMCMNINIFVHVRVSLSLILTNKHICTYKKCYKELKLKYHAQP